jgi:hypothetical protein
MKRGFSCAVLRAYCRHAVAQTIHNLTRIYNMSGKMNGVRACVFDAYGTLFNVHAPVAAMAGRIGRQADQVSKLWRTKQLEYTWLRSLMQACRARDRGQQPAG